jgi:hypothetical protein
MSLRTAGIKWGPLERQKVDKGKKANEGAMDNEKHRGINRKRNRITEMEW